MKPLTCEDITGTLSKAWRVQCDSVGSGQLLLVSPLMFEDGDHVQMMAQAAEGGAMTLDDFGTVQGRMMDRGIAMDTGTLSDQVETVAKSHGVEFRNGALVVDVETQGQLPDAYHRLAAAMLQCDSLHHGARDATRAFSQRVVHWLSVTPEGPIVRPTYNVPGKRKYRINAALYRDLSELEREDPTLLHTASNRSSLEHCFYMYSDLSQPWFRKLVVVPPEQVTQNRPHIDRVLEIATVASFADQSDLVSWTRASDEDRAAGSHFVGTIQRRIE